MWKAWVLLMDANHRQLSAGLQWVWRRLPCYGGCFFLCTCFLWGMATNCVVRATEFWAISYSIIDPIAIERYAFGGGRRKSWLPPCSTVGVLLLRVSSCWGVGLKIRELAAVLLPAVLRTRVARVISFCLLRACLCPIYLSCRLLPGNGDWGTPNFFVVVIFARFFCRQFTNFTCYADERPWSENTSVVTLLGPQGGGGTFPLAYKGWYAFTPLGRGVFLSRHEEEPCSVAITIRICERWPGLAPQNDY